MRILKLISNYLFGTSYNTSRYTPPSKERLIANMYREYGHRDW